MNRFEVDGRPTVGGPLARNTGGGGFTPNQALAAQAAWFIDPINGSNLNNGKTLGTAIRTRSEFYRRMAGVTLTQAVTVTITSSLASTDTLRSFIFENQFNGFSLTFVGLPIPLFTLNSLTITTLVNRNGATNTVTQVTCAALPAANSWSSVIGKLVEVSTGGGNFIRGVVIADLGARTAWISPPITQNAVPTTFTNGQTINVYDCPTLPGSELVYGEAINYQYLQAATWEATCGLAQLISCLGGTVLYSGALSLQNCAGIGVTINPTSIHLNLGGSVAIYGGRSRAIASAGPIRFQASATVVNRGMQVENGCSITTPGQSGVRADIEFQGTAAGDTMAYSNELSGGNVYTLGFVYGSAVDPVLVLFNGSDGTVVFDKLPTVTGATDISFALSAKTSKLSYLTSSQVTDYPHNNRVIGPSGPSLVDVSVRDSALMVAQGILSEPYQRAAINAGSLMIAQTVYGVAIGLKAGDIVTNGLFCSFVGGTTMTQSQMGLYDKNGNRLAQSADQGAAWAVAGALVTPFSAPFTVLITDLYYVAAVANATVMPTLGRTATLAQAQPIPTFKPPFANMTGQANLPVTAVFQTIAAGPLGFWLAVN